MIFDACPTCGGFPTLAELRGEQRHVCPPQWRVRLNDQDDSEARVVYGANAERAVSAYLQALAHTEDAIDGEALVLAYCPETGERTAINVEGEVTIVYTLRVATEDPAATA